MTNFFNTFFVFALFSFCLIFSLFYMFAFLWLLAFDLLISYYFLHSFFSKKHFLSFSTTHPPYSSDCKNAQIILLQAHSRELLRAKGFCKLGYKFLSIFGTKLHKKIQIILVNRFTLLHNLMIKRINYTIPRSTFTFQRPSKSNKSFYPCFLMTSGNVKSKYIVWEKKHKTYYFSQ